MYLFFSAESKTVRPHHIMTQKIQLENYSMSIFGLLLLCRNVIKLFLEEVSLSMMAGLTVRCTTILDVALCATAVKNPSLAGASQPCIVNFTRSTLCAYSALSNLTKAPSKNRMINLIVIHASLNSLVRKGRFFNRGH